MENNPNVNVQNMVEGEELNEMLESSPAARRRKKILLVAVMLCCAAILATGTLAYFTAEETAYNVITTAMLSMDLVEETTGGEPWPEDGVSGVMPGTVVAKIPYVVNNGGIDFWTRLSVSVKVTDANGNPLSDRYISMNVDRENWTEKDGYYYYNTLVQPGQQTKPLFTKVSFHENMPNAYMNAKIEIDVTAEAVQSKHNGIGPLLASWEDFE